jgi:hypothetical protein
MDSTRRTKGRARWLAAGALAGVLALVAAAGASSPRLTAMSGRSPYGAECGVDVAGAGFGDGFEGAEAEVSLAVDPTNPQRLVGAWMQDLYQGYVTASSTDAGRSWQITQVPGVSTCSGGDADLAADPWLSWGPDGRVYLAGFSLDLPDERIPTPIRTRLQVHTSDDGGASWSLPAEVAGGVVALHDKPAVTAHPQRPGTAYLVWTEQTSAFGPASTGIQLSTTSDGGAHWSQPVTVLPPMPPGFIPHGAQLLVASPQTLVVVATMNPTFVPQAGEVLEHAIVSVVSHDGGKTWSAPSPVARFATRGPSFASARDPETGDPIQAPGAFVSAAADAQGTVWLAWRHATSDEHAEIRLSRSDDGLRWTQPQVIAAPGAQLFLPALAVSNRALGVTFYDWRNDRLGDSELSTDVWLATSTDRGRTWRETHVAGPFDLRSSPTRRIPAEGRFLGDYHALVPFPGGFAAAFALPAPFATSGASDIFFSRLALPAGTRDDPMTAAS